MQYRKNAKMLIDRRKLEILIRLNCPDKQLLQVIKTGEFDRTGDALIDDTLECLIDYRDFDNWGGNHNPNGFNQYTKKSGQDGGQVDQKKSGQDDLQKTGQLADIDIDNININNNNKIKEKDLKEKPLRKEEEEFEEFWKLYTPVQCKDGKHIDRGNKNKAKTAFIKARKKDTFENIKDGLKRYLKKCAKNDRYTAQVSTFLNQETWKEEDEDGVLILSSSFENGKKEKNNFQKTIEMMEKMKKEEWN